MKKLFALALFLCLLLSACETKIELPAQETTEPAMTEDLDIDFKVNELYPYSSYKEAYINIINKFEERHEDFEYDLIYLDDDDIPELVAGVNGYFVSVYTYSCGEVYLIMDEWGYGAMGNHGYDYIPKGNVICNYNADLAGLIVYTFYGRINENHEIESYYGERLSQWAFKDLNNNYQMDEGEYNGTDCYYYGNQEITQEEFESYLINGNYESIYGRKSASELIAQLEG